MTTNIYKVSGKDVRFVGYVVARLGEVPRRYDLVEGAGVFGGEWAAVEVNFRNREVVVFETRREAEEHVHLSQLDS